MITADEVGGDFYDILYSDEGSLWIAIGDVSGHGVTAGLIMMMAQTVHTTIATHFSLNPKDVVCTLNEVLCRNVQGRLGKDHFMTFTTLKYQGNGEFEYAGAHLSMVVYRQKTHTCELIRTPGTFLNFIEDISDAAVNSSFTLDIGDILVLYSDGLTEAQNRDGELLDMQRFQEIVKSHAGKETAAMRDAVIQDVLTWCENKRADDMSLVVVRRIK